MANMLDVHEYSRYSLDELVDMIKNLENRIIELEDTCKSKDVIIERLDSLVQTWMDKCDGG